MKKEHLEDLLDYLSERLEKNACDHTHRHTLVWAALRGREPEDVVAFVSGFGGCCCDCEVLLNAPDEVMDTPERERAFRAVLARGGVVVAQALPGAAG